MLVTISDKILKLVVENDQDWVILGVQCTALSVKIGLL